MSKEAVAQFLAKLNNDPQLQQQLVEFAAKNGFEFSAEELTDADLENIAGGLMPTRRSTNYKIAQIPDP